MENYTIPHRWTRKYLALILVKPRPGQDGEAVILAQKSNARRPQNLRLAISWESIEDLDCQDYVLADIPRKDVKKQELKDPIPLFAGSVFTKSRNNASARQGGLIFKYGKVDNGGSEDEDPGLDVSGLVEKEALGSANGKLSSGTAVWMGSSDVEYQASVDYMVTDRWLQGAVAAFQQAEAQAQARRREQAYERTRAWAEAQAALIQQGQGLRVSPRLLHKRFRTQSVPPGGAETFANPYYADFGDHQGAPPGGTATSSNARAAAGGLSSGSGGIMPSPRRPGHTGTTERASHLPDLARGFSIPSQVPKRRMQAPAGPADFQNPFGSPGMAGAVRPIATARGNRKGAHAMPSTTLLNPINPDFQFVQRRPQMPDGNTTKAFHFKAGSGQVPVPVGGPSFAQSQQTSQRPTNQPTSFNHRGPGSKVINSTPRAAERVNVRRAPLAAPVLPTDSPFVENAVTVQPGASGELNFDRPSQKPDESRAASGPSRGKTSHPTR